MHFDFFADSFVDNALVLRDPNSFIMMVMGKEIETGISVNDGQWHHVALTWSSASGSFASYQDGLKIAETTNFQMGQVNPLFFSYLLILGNISLNMLPQSVTLDAKAKG